MRHARLVYLGMVALLVAAPALAQPEAAGDDADPEPALRDFHPKLQEQLDEVVKDLPEDLDGLLDRRALTLRVIEHLQDESRRRLFALERAKALEDRIDEYERNHDAANDRQDPAAAAAIEGQLATAKEELAAHGSTRQIRNQLLLIQDDVAEGQHEEEHHAMRRPLFANTSRRPSENSTHPADSQRISFSMLWRPTPRRSPTMQDLPDL